MTKKDTGPIGNEEGEKSVKESNAQREDHFIVAIGASAGGLEAIHELFDNTPSDTGFSFIIVQHLSPDFKSLMPELLVKHTAMKVCNAEDNAKVEPDCIYFIPNNK